jgi:hypothetical protein
MYAIGFCFVCLTFFHTSINKFRYQDLHDLEEAIRECANPNHPLTYFDTSCFSGFYVTGETIDSEYFKRLHSLRNDDAKHGRSEICIASQSKNKSPPQASNNGCESVQNDKRNGLHKTVSCESLSNNQ